MSHYGFAVIHKYDNNMFSSLCDGRALGKYGLLFTVWKYADANMIQKVLCGNENMSRDAN
jgi:hypothetical protein